MTEACHKTKFMNTIDDFADYVQHGGLDLILGKETPYYMELFAEDYEPGTFTLHDRQIRPDFLSEYEADFDGWLTGVVRRELVALDIIGQLDRPFSTDLVRDMTHQLVQILNFKPRDAGRVSEHIYNQEYTDIIHRIMLWLLTGDPEKELRFFEDLNEMGFAVANAILSEHRDISLFHLLKWCIASGAIGIDLKGQDAATSRFSSLGIELALRKDENPRDRIQFVRRKLEEVSMRGLAIDFWSEFTNEVLAARKKLNLAWITDDYIETVFDLAFIERMLVENDELLVHLVPRAGRFGNDASYQDVVQFLKQPLFKTLKSFARIGRFMVSSDGPTAGCVNGKKMSKGLFNTIANSDAVVVKGARAYETLQGLEKTTYFAFVVCREFSEAVTGLDARALPLVFIRQSEGLPSFFNFKYRAKRTHQFPDGRVIHVAQKTTLEYEKELRTRAHEVRSR